MSDKIVEVNNLKVAFDIKKGFISDLMSKEKKVIKAVDDVSFSINRGEILSLVGESGSGKTTTGKAILQLVKNTGGRISFDGEEVRGADKAYMKHFRRSAQMIFQDPYQSINPRDRVLDIIAEPLDVNHMVKSKEDRLERVAQALTQAGLTPPENYLHRYPHELSGGQRQRLAIASSMILNPSFVVADEPVSMLDASIRTGILRLMLDLKEKEGVAYLFITHDLSLAWLISDRIAIMYLGAIMEIGTADQIIKHGLHPYAKALTSIMPMIGEKKAKDRIVLEGETPDAGVEVRGCKFFGRCGQRMPQCEEERPLLEEATPGHFVACHAQF